MKLSGRSGIISLLIVLFTPFTIFSAMADSCRPIYTLGSANLHLPCVEWIGDTPQLLQVDLSVENTETFLFKWNTQTPLTITPEGVSAIFNANTRRFYIPIIDVETAPGVVLPYRVELVENAEGLLTIASAKPLPAQINSAPTVGPLSLQADLTQPYQTVSLTGTDADGDTLVYELLSSDQGVGYQFAYIDSTLQQLYVKLDAAFNGTVELSYRATDGKAFSDPATVRLNVGDATSILNLGLGSARVTAREVASAPTPPSFLTSTSRSAPGSSATEETLPRSVDLSLQFPIPGNQGSQESCVGWSLGYAIKSYQEAVEGGWFLNENSPDTLLFSPSFIFNQLNEGINSGIKIPDALQLLVDKGAVPLVNMPYTETDFTSQPSAEMLAVASNYKARSWSMLKSTAEVKTALSKNIPVITSMAVYHSFYTLQGKGATYNTQDTYKADHAVVLVGYNDDYPGGGAFKVINSWGTSWGENGYFWLPYSFLSTEVVIGDEVAGTLLNGVYILLDDKNTASLQTETNLVTASVALPNLTVADWQTSYNPVPGGSGIVQYQILNDGNVTAQTVDIALVLSKKSTLDSLYDDYYIVEYEEVAYQLDSGESLTRSESNPKSFTFPYLPSGTYYLHVIVDPYNSLLESNENDNISSSQNSISLINEWADIGIKSFYVEWDRGSLEAKLDYVLLNETSVTVPANSNWKIELILFPRGVSLHDESISQSIHTVWSRTVTEEFPPSPADPSTQPSPFAVDWKNPIKVHLGRDIHGNQIPRGEYELGLMVDPEYVVPQVTYDNNSAYSGQILSIRNDLLPPSSASKLPPRDQNFDPNASYQESSKPPSGDGSQPPPTDGTQPAPTDSMQPAPTDSTQPAPTDSTQPAPTDSTQPAPTDSTQPVITSSTQPVVTSSTQPVITDSTQPVVTSSTQPVLTDSTQPVLTSSTQPVVTDSTQPVLVTAIKPTAILRTSEHSSRIGLRTGDRENIEYAYNGKELVEEFNAYKSLVSKAAIGVRVGDRRANTQNFAKHDRAREQIIFPTTRVIPIP